MISLQRALFAFLGVALLLSPARAATVQLGINVLEQHQFAELKGKRVGLITNATGIDSHGVSTVDVLRHAPGVQLVALFGPEHGVYGSDYAGQYVESSSDPRTGLPVYSLYGPRASRRRRCSRTSTCSSTTSRTSAAAATPSSAPRPRDGSGGRGRHPILRARPARPLNGNRVEGRCSTPGFRNVYVSMEYPVCLRDHARRTGLHDREIARLDQEGAPADHCPHGRVVPLDVRGPKPG